MNEPSAYAVSVGSADLNNIHIFGFDSAPSITVSADLCNMSTNPQHQWRCRCGDIGPQGTDRDATVRAAIEHVRHKGCDHRWVWLETIESCDGPMEKVMVTVGVAPRPVHEGCVVYFRCPRGRRSRQNRSARARAAQRLAIRMGEPEGAAP